MYQNFLRCLKGNRKRKSLVCTSLSALTLTCTFACLVTAPEQPAKKEFQQKRQEQLPEDATGPPNASASRAVGSIAQHPSSREISQVAGKERRGGDAESLSSEKEESAALGKRDVVLDYDAVFNTTETRWPVVVFSTVGRLGNSLNSYATALTFAGRSDVTIAVTQSIYEMVTSLMEPSSLSLPVLANELLFEAQDMGVAEVVQPDYIRDDMVSHLLPTIEKAAKEVAKNPETRKIYILEGYPNRMKMLAGHHSTVRKNFQIRGELKKKAQNFLGKIRKSVGKNPTFVGFHIRRTDYVKFSQIFQKCSLPSSDYYDAALDYYRTHYTRPVFVVASDDMSHARKHLAHANDVFFSEMSLPEEDLSLLASCNHSIMTAGSFGFWASYLAGGEVLYSLLRGCVFTPFVHPGSVAGEGFERWRGL
ncbi:galactoside alpha-(1,2)-fucosyltransferase 2-like [Penaeus vannamei]|uniref:galactoside alpha-(1,2)-fucosyltransferase 2-like n=1 Tax=Penaeus vannamei TaxID=6689 RepID=UPI00387F5751